MRIVGTILFSVAASVFACSCLCEKGNHMDNREESDKTAYFASVDLKRAPVRVFDPIPAEQIANYQGSYYEASFNSANLVVSLRHLRQGKEFWAAAFEYSAKGKLTKEIWKEGGTVRVREFSPKGRVTNEVSHPVNAEQEAEGGH